MSSIVNKVKDALHKDNNTHNTHNTHEVPEGTHGSHNSRVTNAADPRIDSDRDHRAAHTTGLHEGTHARPAEGAYSGGAYNTAEGVHGPHSSRLANTADPRIDSDRDNRAAPHSTIGGTGNNYGSGVGTHTAGTHTAGTHAAPGGSAFGNTGTHAAPGGSAFGSTGTHGTSRTTGTTGTAFGSGTGASEGAYGPHSSRTANAADPRVDSDRDNRAAHHSALGSSTGGATTGYGAHHTTMGTGPAPNTAGPHKSDMLNKADPRVDSNLDGSKTVGGNMTMGGSNTGHY